MPLNFILQNMSYTVHHVLQPFFPRNQDVVTNLTWAMAGYVDDRKTYTKGDDYQ